MQIWQQNISWKVMDQHNIVKEMETNSGSLICKKLICDQEGFDSLISTQTTNPALRIPKDNQGYGSTPSWATTSCWRLVWPLSRYVVNRNNSLFLFPWDTNVRCAPFPHATTPNKRIDPLLVEIHLNQKMTVHEWSRWWKMINGLEKWGHYLNPL